ncbi:hypothetical protein [Candidatus Endomicrobiellum devescovinae]|uniref:hypothetical protein n=1 Tax=Candidatus Endomicrobiellum devescovinae TaxID=3242322 RepID=UPI00282DF862|nr:hypothetical protein [Endomicrobium sp.]
MKRLILAVLLCYFFCTVNGAVAIARELKYYLLCNEADKARAEADVAYAKAKLKDAKASIVLSKADKIFLETLPKGAFNHSELDNEKYNKDASTSIKARKKRIKRLIGDNIEVIKANDEVAKAYDEAAVAYEKAAKLYAIVADIKDTKNLKDDTKITGNKAFAEASKTAEAYAQTAKAYAEAARANIELEIISKAYNELPRIPKDETFKEKFSNYLKEGREANNRFVKVRIAALNEESKAVKAEAKLMLSFEHK